MTPFPTAVLASALAARVERPVTIHEVTPVEGGCIHQASRLATSAGPFFAKWHPAPPPGLFGAEAAGLQALRNSGSALVVPEPVAWSDGDEEDSPGPAFLITDWLATGSPGQDFDEALGLGLAALHRASAAEFGFARDGYCGLTPQANGWLPRWADFYRERRLEPQLRLAVDGRRLDSSARQIFYRVLDRLDELLADTEERPALLHGDLWSGNLLATTEGRPALVDPAAYYGHREAEFGMTMLFGGLAPAVYSAYENAWPLLPDWRERNGLYQLYHLLNHVNLFGEQYVAMAVGTARGYA